MMTKVSAPLGMDGGLERILKEREERDSARVLLSFAHAIRRGELRNSPRFNTARCVNSWYWFRC